MEMGEKHLRSIQLSEELRAQAGDAMIQKTCRNYLGNRLFHWEQEKVQL